MKTLRLLVGTYEEKQGIWELRLDVEGKNVLSSRCVSRTRRNSYLAVRKDFCLAVSETPLAEGNTGALHSFRITDEGLEPIHSLENLPCLLPHLWANRAGTVVYTASYGTGEILAIRMKDGMFGDIISHTQNVGSSVNPKRQTCAHPHSVWLSPDEQFLYLCDLGTDEIIWWPLNNDGSISLKKKRSLRVPAGYGPRHMVFSPDGKRAYALCEMAYHVLVMEIGADGSLKIAKDVSLEGDIPREEQNGGAIRMSPNGESLYCSNRSRIRSRIDLLCPETLEVIGKSLTNCLWPRDFYLTEDGHWLLCGNQMDNSLSVFRKNAGGEMEFYWKIPEIPTPVCVAVLEN